MGPKTCFHLLSGLLTKGDISFTRNRSSHHSCNKRCLSVAFTKQTVNSRYTYVWTTIFYWDWFILSFQVIQSKKSYIRSCLTHYRAVPGNVNNGKIRIFKGKTQKLISANTLDSHNFPPRQPTFSSLCTNIKLKSWVFYKIIYWTEFVICSYS